MKTVLAFGTFDPLHEGHVFFLTNAKMHGDKLVVVVPQDETVTQLKNKKVRQTLNERIECLEKLGIADHITPGDHVIGTWSVLKEHRPHVVAIGHDQHALEEALLSCKDEFDFPFETVRLPYLDRSAN